MHIPCYITLVQLTPLNFLWDYWQARRRVSFPRSCALAAKASHASTDAEPRQAAALIIGNEILSGSITDTNTPWLAKLLYRYIHICLAHQMRLHLCHAADKRLTRTAHVSLCPVCCNGSLLSCSVLQIDVAHMVNNGV